MKDPLIAKLTTLRDAAPTISYAFPDQKTTKPGALASFAHNIIEFQHGKAQYKVHNTWEHFDYLIRQWKRLHRASYGCNENRPRNPNFRTRRSAEQGFKTSMVPGTKLIEGSIVARNSYLRDFLIVTHSNPKTGITLQHLSDHSQDPITIQPDSMDLKTYLIHRPEWFFIEYPLATKNFYLIRRHNPALYQTLRTHLTAIKLYNAREQLRIERAA